MIMEKLEKEMRELFLKIKSPYIDENKEPTFAKIYKKVNQLDFDKKLPATKE